MGTSPVAEKSFFLQLQVVVVVVGMLKLYLFTPERYFWESSQCYSQPP